jgi:hypothetical protein
VVDEWHPGVQRACRADTGKEDGVIRDAKRLLELAVEMGERTGDHRLASSRWSGSTKASRNFDLPGAAPWRATSSWSSARMLTPKRPPASMACAAAASESIETRTVGGSAETDAKAVTVMPHGRPSSSHVSKATPLARALIASANGRRAAMPDVGLVMRLSLGTMGLAPRPAVGGRLPETANH